MSGETDLQSLERSLSRATLALERGWRPSAPGASRERDLRTPAALGALAAALVVLALTTGQHWLLALAALVGIIGGYSARPRLPGEPGKVHVGLGATIAADAVLEPGSSVEMGADVGARAVVRSGAVVRMGASVGKGTVIEKGAIVSWGADVHEGAVVGEGAIVGAGSDVLRGARVPAGLWLKPGSDFGGVSTPPGTVQLPDSRQARAAVACDKLEAELRASPERVRAFLGGSDQTIASLRRTCEDLARRQQELRAEADAEALTRLEEERAALQKRAAAERDAQIATSLQGALAAIDEQKRQRELVRLAADRLEAEHTRLLYTLEGLAAQFVRLRSAGQQAQPAELEASVTQLRGELDAISDALEDVAQAAPPARVR